MFNIKEIVPETQPRQKLTTQKPVQKVVNQETQTIEWGVTVEVSKKELDFVRSRVSANLPIDRVTKVKEAVVEGLNQSEMVARFRNEKGLKNLSHIKNIRAALSEFNGWDLSGRTKNNLDHLKN